MPVGKEFMETNPEKILKAIPDFDEFMKLSSEISTLMYEKMVMESKIRSGESRVFEIATTNESYFQNGKPPASTFIDNTWKYRGLEGELIPLRNELAKTVSQLEEKKLQMDIYKSMLEVWRTLSANQRSAGV